LRAKSPLAGRFVAAELNVEGLAPPVETVMGALLSRIIGGAANKAFQPMNVNFGLMPLPRSAQGRWIRGKPIYRATTRAIRRLAGGCALRASGNLANFHVIGSIIFGKS
jgi:folate-dependent tRNA-U54 methylase TrmFO/GidA